MELGMIETVAGAKGGVRFIPHINDAQSLEAQEQLCNLLQSPDRILGGVVFVHFRHHVQSQHRQHPSADFCQEVRGFKGGLYRYY